MVFGKKTNLTGLDIGSNTIKVVELSDSKEVRSLERIGLVNLAAGVIEDGVIKNSAAAAEAIKDLFEEHNIKDRNVAVSIGGYSVIVKKINVQTMTDEQLQETIQLEAEQYIPFDVSDVNIDFQILGENESNPNQMEVLLVAAKKEMVEDYVNLVVEAGLNPCVLDVDAFALQNIYELNYDTEDENVAIIDIGACKTSLNILKGDVSVFMRDVSLGCGQINEKIISLIDCSYEDAEQIKQSEQSDSISQNDLRGIVSSVVTDWSTEISRALDFFYSSYPDDQITKIILSGGGANVKEFRDLLSDETSTEVDIINPFEKFEIAADRFDSSYLAKIAPQAAICMGLAIRKIDDK